MNIDKKATYTFYGFVLNYLQSNKARKIALRELRESYESRTGKKLSRTSYPRALKKAVRQLPGYALHRQEQLWLCPVGVNATLPKDSMLGMNKRTHNHRIHSAHKIKLSISYEGKQPTEDADGIRPFGRYKTQKQSIYKFVDITIVAFKKKLNVWVHNPPGTLTTEQLINAKTRGYVALVQFARLHNLKLEGYLNKVLMSHHVTEDADLNKLLKPFVQEYEKEIYERIGTKVCNTSHKGKVEHEGKKNEDRIVHGHKVAMGLEYLTTQFPDDFGKLTEANMDFRVNLQEHLGAVTDIRTGIGELTDAVKEMNRLLKKMP